MLAPRPSSGPRPLASLLAALVTSVLMLVGSVASAQDFTKITGVDPTTEVGGARASTWIDMDSDGDLDLYVTRGGSVNELNILYRNDAGTFVQDTANPVSMDSIRADGASWGDYDGDGDDDVFVVSWHGELNALFQNEGGGVFSRVTTGAAVTTGTHSETASWVDYDQDGDLDLFVTNSDAEDNLLYRNDGGGILAPQGSGPLVNDGNQSRQGTWGDYDNDGDLDMFLANDVNQTNKLYKNFLAENGVAFFQEQAAGVLTTQIGATWSGSWADYDNDGDLDIIVANNSGGFNTLFRNELTETGSATFTELTAAGPSLNRGWSVGTHWADVDNDADLDLFITNGWATGGQLRRNFFYRNDGGDLVRISTGTLHDDQGWSFGASFGDYDADGDLDLHVANWYNNAQADYLYRNEAQANGNHWLTVKCEGTVSNTTGIGARIRVKATVGGSPVWQMRDVSGSDGYCSQSLRQHFGLGDATTVDSLVVSWPSGTEQVFVSVSVDQLLTVVEPSAVGVTEEAPRGQRLGALRGASPNPFRSGTAIQYQVPTAASVTLAIHDVRGRMVRTLESGTRAAGAHDIWWDGQTDAGADVAAGVYFARLTVRDGGAAPSARVETSRVLRVR